MDDCDKFLLGNRAHDELCAKGLHAYGPSSYIEGSERREVFRQRRVYQGACLYCGKVLPVVEIDVVEPAVPVRVDG